MNKTKVFVKYINAQGYGVLKVDKNHIKDYLYYLRNDLKLKSRSIESIFAAISAFYEYLAEEELVDKNPIRSVRKRYLHSFKKVNDSSTRKLISVEDAAKLVNSILHVRDQAIVLLLFKTGIRINELVSLDVDDINLDDQSIMLKPTAKRSNRLVYFDNETADVLVQWVRARTTWGAKSPALFVSSQRLRINDETVRIMIKNYASRIELCDPSSNHMEDRFTPHCCRHWFTTHLRRAGMPREFIQELRGDVRKEAIDIYDHIDRKELKESYLAHIPQLGV